MAYNSYKWHQVKSGETIGQIAGRYGSDPFSLLKLNPSTGNTLALGSYLRIPDFTGILSGLGTGFGKIGQSIGQGFQGLGQGLSPLLKGLSDIGGFSKVANAASTYGLTPLRTEPYQPINIQPGTMGTEPYQPYNPSQMHGKGYSNYYGSSYAQSVTNLLAAGTPPAVISDTYITDLLKGSAAGSLTSQQINEQLLASGYVYNDANKTYELQTGQGIGQGIGQVDIGGGQTLDSKYINGAGKKAGEWYFNPKTGNWRTNGGGGGRRGNNGNGNPQAQSGGGEQTLNVGWRIG